MRCALKNHSVSVLGEFGDVWMIHADGSGAFNLSDDPSQELFPN